MWARCLRSATAQPQPRASRLSLPRPLTWWPGLVTSAAAAARRSCADQAFSGAAGPADMESGRLKAASAALAASLSSPLAPPLPPLRPRYCGTQARWASQHRLRLHGVAAGPTQTLLLRHRWRYRACRSRSHAGPPLSVSVRCQAMICVGASFAHLSAPAPPAPACASVSPGARAARGPISSLFPPPPLIEFLPRLQCGALRSRRLRSAAASASGPASAGSMTGP